MKFSKEIVINRPLGQVLKLLADPEHVRRWQPGIVSITPLSGTRGQVGAQSRLAYHQDGRAFELVETIKVSNLPVEHTATYETKGMVHTISNHFSAIDDQTTRMVSENDMQFSGAMKVMGKVIAGSLRKESEKAIERFKTFAETAEPVPHVS